MHNRLILIIDDSESIIKCIIEGFKTFYEDDWFYPQVAGLKPPEIALTYTKKKEFFISLGKILWI